MVRSITLAASTHKLQMHQPTNRDLVADIEAAAILDHDLTNTLVLAPM